MPIFGSLKDYSSDKVVDYVTARRKIDEIKAENMVVGLCHGAFDLLHPGHIRHFASAKSLCDSLFVSITSDRFVNLSRGRNRPIFSDILRAYFVANISLVDYVVISNFEKGIEVIESLRPSYYIKGPDYINKTEEENPALFEEINRVRSIGGEIKYTLDEKLSTSGIIDYIKKNC